MSKPCPECGAPDADRPDNPHRPFCGQRCQQQDLLKWLDGDYKIMEPLIPGVPMQRDDEEPEVQ